jgi:uncharacterized protein
MNRRLLPILISIMLLFHVAAGCQPQDLRSPVERIPVNELTAADRTLLGARAEVRNRTRYDASYVAMEYPGGDVPADRGACTDVVVRALRNAGYDLQMLIHEDMQANFSQYPSRWGLTRPDSNIDHRRVSNQMTFFQRHGLSLTTEVEEALEEWQWGDVVCWDMGDGQLHTGIISDWTNADGVPLVIHNGWITREEDCLTRWKIIGHYRYPGEQ